MGDDSGTTAPALPAAARWRTLLRRLVIAAGCVALAIGFRELALAPLGSNLAYVTFYPAVAVAAMFGGAIGGLAATLMAAAVVHGWLIPLASTADGIGLATFLLSGTLISGLAEARARAWARATAAETRIRLRAVEDRYRGRTTAIRAQAAVAIAETDAEGRLTLVNDRCCAMLGDGRAALIGAPLLDRIRPEDRAAYARLVADLIAGGDAGGTEVRVARPDGEPASAYSSLAAIRDHLGRVDSVVHVMVDTTELRRQETELRASHQRLELALDIGGIGTWDLDVGSNVSLFDDRARRIYGFTADDLICPERVFARIDPADRPAAQRAFAAAHDPAGDGDYRAEYRVRRPGESVPRWISARGRAFFADGRPVRMIGLAADITARRLAEEQVRLLSREVNHRAKNLLAVVQTVARQTAGRDDPAVFAERFSDRIAGLAAGQDLLVRSDWQGVCVRDLVQAQLAHFRDLVGGRIGLAGPTTVLNAQAAQTIGMALHELATNAGKYGALATGDGRVDIDWTVEDGAVAGDQRSPVFMMRWTEQGGPPVREPARRGFGHVLMVDVVRHALDAEVDLQLTGHRVVWAVTCPAATALCLETAAEGVATAANGDRRAEAARRQTSDA